MTVDFSLPPGLGDGVYQVATIANGIPSNNVTITIGGGIVTASYKASTNTLTLIGDAKPNTVTVTRNTMTGVVTVSSSNGTKVNNSAGNLTFTPVGQIAINAVLGDGDDSLSLINLNTSTVDIKLGNGLDSASFRFCTVDKLVLDGGPGIDTYTTFGSTIPPVGPNRIITNIP
jgi:hypothetical protein